MTIRASRSSFTGQTLRMIGAVAARSPDQDATGPSGGTCERSVWRRCRWSKTRSKRRRRTGACIRHQTHRGAPMLPGRSLSSHRFFRLPTISLIQQQVQRGRRRPHQQWPRRRHDYKNGEADEDGDGRDARFQV